MGESFSYEDIYKLQIDDIKVKLVDKIANYIEVMSLFCDKEEINLKSNYLVDNIKELIRKYAEDKLALNNYDSENFDRSMIDVYRMELKKYKDREKQISSLLNDDKAFLNFFLETEEETKGLVFKNEDGIELYKGINEALAERVIANVNFINRKSDPSEEDDEVIRQPFAKDEIPVFLSNKTFEGLDVFKHFFRGDGYGFHKKMTKIIPDQQMLYTFNKCIDESVLEDKNDSYNKFEAICQEILNSNYSLKSSQTL